MSSNSRADALIEAVKSSRFAFNGCFEPAGKQTGASSETRNFLYDQWKSATKDLGLSEKAAAEWFDRIYNRHTEDARHYHTPIHLEEMCHYFRLFADAEMHPSSPGELQVVLLAIFFHDVIYDARSATNEEDSAKLFESFAEEVRIPSLLAKTVVEYIIATKKHKVSEENPAGLALFLDLDMAVLGKKTTAYMQYAALIRKEYIFVPHDVYCHKRAEVLETFLQQDKIYGTAVMHTALENQARSNVQKEIESLRKGVIPCIDEKG